MRDQVYQPTTTTLTFDRNKTWLPSFLAQGTFGSWWSRTLILVLSVMFAVMGLVMIIVGATSYKSLEDGSVKEINSTAYIIILCLGVILEIAAIFAIIFYMRTMGYYMPCCPGKIARIRKRLHQNQMMVNGQLVNAGEPVSAQYCPPTQPGVGNTPPPPYTDVSEEQRLMEEKADLGNDDTERILEEDPRIVLTPLKPHEEC
ncbi:hypothetical protein Pmani_014552 [Petrolisthes manimaculis]|uniref:Uncharacterized protein n=1 Tax=Petrolisthes manimaculis TaxID=1843537 RepID=A0AAE1U8K5_9EUCA|nr:hypothetical protein Pmani_014552 [Petrolisthes manimaculis]